MADKMSREVTEARLDVARAAKKLAELHEGEKVVPTKALKVDVDVSDALTGLKAVQREAKKATQALREVESVNKSEFRVKEHAQHAGIGVVIDDTARKPVAFFDIGVFSTKSLSDELARRTGVREYVVPLHESARIGWLTDGSSVDITGPARILVNRD